MEHSKDHAQCGHNKEFNYCFWAKLLVAIPIFPLAALIGASFFDSVLLQIAGAVSGVVVVVFLSKWIDTIPAFSKKIHLRKP